MKKESLITVAAGAGVVTLLTIALSELRSNYEAKWIMFAAFLVVAIGAIVLGFYTYWRGENRFEKLSENLETFTSQFANFETRLTSLEATIGNQTQFSWILSTQQLIDLEKAKANCAEIWIATEYPCDDTEESPWVPVIHDNLEDGIAYVYVCPNNDRVHGAIQPLKDVFRDHLEQCRILLIDREDFERLPYPHIVVYDPKNTAGELDCLSEIDGREKGWWLRLHNSQRNRVISRLAPLTADAKLLSSF